MSFKLPPDASEADKQAALASFRQALQDKMTQKSNEELIALWAKFQQNDATLTSLRTGDQNAIKQGLIDTIMKQQDQILAESNVHVGILNTDWGKAVDDYLRNI